VAEFVRGAIGVFKREREREREREGSYNLN